VVVSCDFGLVVADLLFPQVAVLVNLATLRINE
jgi:hypothetical protein